MRARRPTPARRRDVHRPDRDGRAQPRRGRPGSFRRHDECSHRQPVVPDGVDPAWQSGGRECCSGTVSRCGYRQRRPHSGQDQRPACGELFRFVPEHRRPARGSGCIAEKIDRPGAFKDPARSYDPNRYGVRHRAHVPPSRCPDRLRAGGRQPSRSASASGSARQLRPPAVEAAARDHPRRSANQAFRRPRFIA